MNRQLLRQHGKLPSPVLLSAIQTGKNPRNIHSNRIYDEIMTIFVIFSCEYIAKLIACFKEQATSRGFDVTKIF